MPTTTLRFSTDTTFVEMLWSYVRHHPDSAFVRDLCRLNAQGVTLADVENLGIEAGHIHFIAKASGPLMDLMRAHGVKL